MNIYAIYITYHNLFFIQAIHNAANSLTWFGSIDRETHKHRIYMYDWIQELENAIYIKREYVMAKISSNRICSWLKCLYAHGDDILWLSDYSWMHLYYNISWDFIYSTPASSPEAMKLHAGTGKDRDKTTKAKALFTAKCVQITK